MELYYYRNKPKLGKRNPWEQEIPQTMLLMDIRSMIMEILRFKGKASEERICRSLASQGIKSRKVIRLALDNMLRVKIIKETKVDNRSFFQLTRLRYLQADLFSFVPKEDRQA